MTKQNEEDQSMMRNTHAGRELALLLSGAKPLAVFSMLKKEHETLCFEGQNFDLAVREGKLCRFERVFEVDSNKNIFYVAFSSPNETWRAFAYFHIKQFMFERSWCAHLEWIEGSLLGYSSAENKEHLLKKYGIDALKKH